MPTLTKHQKSLRVLIVGDPGSGKSTAVGKLAEHDQELFICDFDDNLNPLPQFITPKALERIHYETLLDDFKFDQKSGTAAISGIPQAWPRYIKLAEQWVDSETGEDYGKPDEWEDNRWFVEDSLTSKSNAAMNYTLFKHKRAQNEKRIRDWGVAIDRLESSIIAFQSSNVNYICTAHLARLHMEDVTENVDADGDVVSKPTAAKRLPPNAMMRYPVALGQKLPPKIGGYFNLVLQAVRVGSGVGARRILRTVPEEDVDIKVPLPPKTVPTDVPIDQLWTILKHFK